MRRTSWTLALLGVAWGIGHPVAGASPLLEQMGGFGDMGGQQARLLSTGPSAAYFNPALLTEAPTSASAGAIVLGTRIAVSLMGSGSLNVTVPDGLENALRADGTRFDFYPLGTATLQNGRPADSPQGAASAHPRQGQGSGKQTLSYESVGIVAHFLDKRLAIGFCGLIPNGNFLRLRSFYVDEREQFTSNSLHPELYGDRMTSLGFGVGAGYRFNDKFSLGAGAAITFVADADAPAYVASANQLDQLIINVDVHGKAGLAPHGGFLWRPTARLRFTGTVHAPQQLEVRSDFKFLLASGIEQASSLKWTFDWQPWQAGLGTSYDVVKRQNVVFSLAASALYGRWSKYVDRHGERPASQFGWYDTVTGAVGSRLMVHNWRYGLDLQYKPTPVPLQQGRSNYVDNDRIGVAQGLEYTIPLGDTKLKIGAQVQLYWFLERFAQKVTPPTFADGVNRTPWLVRDELPDDARIGARPVAGAAGLQTNNPGWPGFSSRGWLASGGLYLALTL
jgi:long-chain fatty acid transport protein